MDYMAICMEGRKEGYGVCMESGDRDAESNLSELVSMWFYGRAVKRWRETSAPCSLFFFFRLSFRAMADVLCIARVRNHEEF